MTRQLSSFLSGALLTILSLIHCTPALGENPVTDGKQGLYEKYHPLTKEALLSALHDQDSDVKVLAALTLADGEFKDAIPFILIALENEPVAGSRVNLALAAARLGSEDGFLYLRNECGGHPDREPVLRMLAAQAMVDLQHQDCLGSVLDIIKIQENPQSVIQALYILPSFVSIPNENRAEIKGLASALLVNPDIITRMLAADTLSNFGDSSSRSVLKRALTSERDQNARGALEKALTSLDLRLTQQNP